jgi:hypothetical protein
MLPSPSSLFFVPVRSYIANFWTKPTAKRFPGKIGTSQAHFKYGNKNHRVSEGEWETY